MYMYNYIMRRCNFHDVGSEPARTDKIERHVTCTRYSQPSRLRENTQANGEGWSLKGGYNMFVAWDESRPFGRLWVKTEGNVRYPTVVRHARIDAVGEEIRKGEMSFDPRLRM